MDFGIRRFRSLLFMATLGMGAEFFLALADTVIAGHLVGENALGGINLLLPVFSLVQFVAALVGTGTAVRYSFETGRLDQKRATEMFSQGFWTILAFGLLLLAAFVFGREAFLGCFHADPAHVDAARTYWKCYTPCIVLLPMTLYLISLVYADGDMFSCALGYGALIIGNIVISYFLCRRMGVAGCALGTVIGNFVAMLSLSSHFLHKANSLKLIRHFRFRDLWLVCKSSFADASVSLCWALLFFLLAKLVLAEFGPSRLPVLSVVLVCVNLTLLFNGIAAAVQPVVGVFAGERNDRAIREVMNAAMLIAFLEGLAAAVFFAVFPAAAVRLVGGINTPENQRLALGAVRIVAFGFIGAPFVFLFNSYYLFIERYALAIGVTLFADICVYAVLCPPAAHFFGPTGLWVSLGVSPVLAVVGYALFVMIRYGRERFPLLLDPARARNQFAISFRVSAAAAERAAEAVSAALRRLGLAASADEAVRIIRRAFAKMVEINAGVRVNAEVGFDCNDGVCLCLRDDGRIVDLPAAAGIVGGRHFITSGYNKNVFRLQESCGS